jgi:trimethylamine-N-oxide reductase cytochrome c-type subunit TorC
MKKSLIFGIVFLTISLYASETMYTSSVKNLFETSNSTASKGRLLPTSEVKVIEKKDGKVKVEIEGFMKVGVSNALYFAQGKRILVAGLSKSGKFDIKTISTRTGKNGTEWKKVVLTAYTKDDNLTKNLDVLYEEANKLFKDNCAMCHPIHASNEFTSNQWPSMIKSMISRTAMTKEQNYLVTQFLQKHAKDMKGK